MDDEILEKLGDYYCSEFVKEHMPWIREIPFYEFVQRVMGGQEFEF